MLALEIEYLTGTVVAARSDDEMRVDWPPQPDRVFSALVASWGARGERPAERAALQWLECQDAPLISAKNDVYKRSVPKVFVPPNDFKTSVGGFDVIPARRRRQERRFPTARLNDPVVRMIWNVETDIKLRENLDSLAKDMAYVGHSSSLTRCRFVDDTFDLSDAQPAVRSVYEGRLRELEDAFHAGRRPNPGAVAPALRERLGETIPRTVFSSEWIVLDDAGGRKPDLLAAAIVARKIRDALIGSYNRTFGGEAPEWITGHRADQSPSNLPHLAVVPLADVGWKYSEGRIVGYAIVPPRAIPRETVREYLWPTIGTLLETQSGGEPAIELHYGEKDDCCYLHPQQYPEKSSLRSARWNRKSRLWSTATPIVLDRFPKKNAPDERAAEIGECIKSACRNIGLPTPSYVSYGSASAIRGVPQAGIGRGALDWQRWQLPRALAGRYLVHATIGFDEKVEGPLLLGAGRYAGLGLCLPVEPAERKS